MALSRRQTVHWLFDAAVIVKAVNGVLEVAGGLILALKPGWVGPAVASWVVDLMLHHSANRIGRAIAVWGYGLQAGTEEFASVYLMAHGLAKLFIAWGLIREKLWAFPVALAVFGLLISYQVYRVAHTHSTTLTLLIVLDLAVCYLIWREWGYRKAGEPQAGPAPTLPSRA